MKMRSTRKLICLAGTAVIWGLALYLIVPQLTEAYGSGSPYYGRSTNMDKWSNPLPFVALVIAIAVALSYAFWWFAIRNKK